MKPDWKGNEEMVGFLFWKISGFGERRAVGGGCSWGAVSSKHWKQTQSTGKCELKNGRTVGWSTEIYPLRAAETGAYVLRSSWQLCLVSGLKEMKQRRRKSKRKEKRKRRRRREKKKRKLRAWWIALYEWMTREGAGETGGEGGKRLGRMDDGSHGVCAVARSSQWSAPNQGVWHVHPERLYSLRHTT